PIKETSNVCALSATSSVKTPSLSVVVANVVPFTFTVAPTRGAPASSKTLPVNVRVWAKTSWDTRRIISVKTHRIRKLFSICIIIKVLNLNCIDELVSPGFFTHSHEVYIASCVRPFILGFVRTGSFLTVMRPSDLWSGICIRHDDAGTDHVSLTAGDCARCPIYSAV